MKKNICHLCGGKIVGNRCSECGLDYARQQGEFSAKKSNPDTPPPVHKKSKKEKNKNVRNFLILISLVASIGIPQIKALVRWADDKSVQHTQNITEKAKGAVSLEQAIHFIDREELPAEGEKFDTILVGGSYRVGVHIPPGTYKVELQNGEGIIRKEGNMTEYFLEELAEDKRVVTDLKLYDGEDFHVDEKVAITLSTENAQVEKMSGEENPLSEAVSISQIAVSGKEFPEGVYDAYVEKGSGLIVYKYMEEVDVTNVLEYILCNGDIEEVVYHNLILPKGMAVSVLGSGVRLIPSQKIISTDYAGYYQKK